jgi:hypothetical protein
MRRRTAKRPFPAVAIGDVLVQGRLRLRVRTVESHVERREGAIEHVMEVFTRRSAKRRVRRNVGAGNVVRMPAGDSSVVAQFIRYHVLVRVYRGDADAWLADLEERGDSGGDMRFVRWIRSRLRREPALMASIRKMVEATPFWRVAEA